MTLQVLAHRPYTFLPSGILIVEPHQGLLAARSMLLAAADYYVCASETARKECPRVEGHEVAIAILSESLGFDVLSATAQVVRWNWPQARILVFGRTRAAIEDNLYDARIDHRASQEDLLAAMTVLSEDPWRQRTGTTSLFGGFKGIHLAGQNGSWRIAESDLTKQFANRSEPANSLDLPSEEQHFSQAS